VEEVFTDAYIGAEKEKVQVEEQYADDPEKVAEDEETIQELEDEQEEIDETYEEYENEVSCDCTSTTVQLVTMDSFIANTHTKNTHTNYESINKMPRTLRKTLKTPERKKAKSLMKKVKRRRNTTRLS
jgi:hypothetical protein